jgi:hypothetical protein
LMLRYLKWYDLQVFVSPCKNVFELLQQLTQLRFDNRFQINVDFNLLRNSFRTQVDFGQLFILYDSLVSNVNILISFMNRCLVNCHLPHFKLKKVFTKC